MERWGIWCRKFGEAGQWLWVEDQLRLFDSFAEADKIARQLDREMNQREAAFSYMARTFQ